MIDPAFWRDRRVLLTGHTGFKGAWLTLWLAQLGARVVGFGGRDEPDAPTLFALSGAADALDDRVTGDVRDPAAVDLAVRRARPEVVLHLGAQALVPRSLREPAETYAVNVMGTVHLLDAVRRMGAEARAVVSVTTDQCYRRSHPGRAHPEDDALGGPDPYSSSKACQELVTAAFRDSHLAARGVRVATTRAGNLVGGGDWGADRLVPDLVRAAVADAPLIVRSPDAVRPWQHVLNPLCGYLTLAERLAGEDGDDYAAAYNFGPADEDVRPVRWVVERLVERWPGSVTTCFADPAEPATEAVRVDCARARERLGWRPAWDLETGLDATVEWYAAQAAGEDARELTLRQIDSFAGVATR